MPDTYVDTLPQGREMAPAPDAIYPEPQQPNSPDTDAPPRERGKLLLWGLGALAAAIATAVYGVTDRGYSENRLVQLTDQEAIPTVNVIHPVRGVTGQQIVLPGTVDAWFQDPIYARVSGYLKMWYKDIGARVRVGELLATIETPDLDQELAQAKANLGVADANYQLARVTATRWQRLLKSDAVSVQDVDVKVGDAPLGRRR
ncbi:MAG: hypothetical protein QOG73_2829 [Acetobacteraceae bacterium]|jgi:multidrug efflux pump subunit AcrA (membrane-fusion protein)|nr:hypothetical protein [Acetobacteraceae bacterium]